LKVISNRNKSPLYSISLNNQIIDDYKFKINQTSKFEVEHLIELEYKELKSLEIRLLNKEPNDTIVKDGKIIEDVALIISNIVIQGIDFSSKIGKIFKYTDNKNELLQTYGFMHVNGSMIFELDQNILYTDWITSYKVNL
jgi:hypothetical protein